MAIATKPKPKTTHHKKRTAAHHRQTKQYKQSYWPYIPMLVVISLGIIFSGFMSHPRAVLGWQQNLNQEAMLLETNNDRRAHQMQSLSLNTQLIQAAQSKANDMIQKDYWKHTSPSGKQPWDFAIQAGYQYQQLGENLAYGFTSADGVLNAWMQSPEHRANVLESSYTQVGFGIAEAKNFQGQGAQTVVVAMYGLPSTTAAYSEGERQLINDTFDNSVRAISRVEAMKPALSGLVVGIIGTLAVLAIVLRHSITWRKLVKRGEKFVIKHPWLDTLLVSIVVVAVLLTQTVGFIR